MNPGLFAMQDWEKKAQVDRRHNSYEADWGWQDEPVRPVRPGLIARLLGRLRPQPQDEGCPCCEPARAA